MTTIVMVTVEATFAMAEVVEVVCVDVMLVMRGAGMALW